MTIYYVIATIVFVLGIAITYFFIKTKDKMDKKPNVKETKKVIVEDIIEKYFNIDRFENNVIINKQGQHSVILRYSTEDSEGLAPEDLEEMEKNIIDCSKTFRGSVKIIVREDRQDLKGLSAYLEKRLDLPEISDGLKSFIRRYADYLNGIAYSKTESQISKYIVVTAKTMETLKKNTQGVVRHFESGGNIIELLSRKKTLEVLLESVHHSTRESINPAIDFKTQLAPESLEDLDDYLVIGSRKFCRVYGIIGVSDIAKMGNYDELFKALGNKVDIAFLIDPITAKNGKAILNKEIAIARTNYTSSGDEAYATRENYAEEVKGGISNNKNSLHKMIGYIKVWGESYEELNKNSDALEEEIDKLGTTIRVHTLQQTKAFVSSLPYAGNYCIPQEEYRNYIDKYRFLSLVATGKNGMQHKNGQFLGYEKKTKSTVIYNPFIGSPQLVNPMIILLGTTGSGKTETLLGMTEREAAAGYTHVLLDLENEARERVESLGGTYIDLRPGEKSGINPMDVEVEEQDNGTRYVDLHAKRSEVLLYLNYLKVMYTKEHDEVEGLERIVIEEAVLNVYGAFGITKDPESIYEVQTDSSDELVIGRVKKKMPQLNDLRIELAKHALTENLAGLMKLITGTGSMSIFDCQTSVDIMKQKMVCFGFKEITDESTRQFCTVNLLQHVWIKFSDFRYKQQPKSLKIDEGWFVLENQTIGNIVNNALRRGRKYMFSVLIGTQYISDALPQKNDKGSVVLNAAATKIIMKQDAPEARLIVNYLGLDEEYVKTIIRFGSGDSLFIAGNNKSTIYFQRL